jgi:signal transduction histidine kinase
MGRADPAEVDAGGDGTQPGLAASGLHGAGDSQFEARAIERSVGKGRLDARWMGWRLRLLVGIALLGCLGIFGLLRWLASTAHLDAQWRAAPGQQLELLNSSDPALRAQTGKALRSIEAANAMTLPAEALALQRSPRWTVDDRDRQRLIVTADALAQALAQPNLRLHFDNGESVGVAPSPRGYAGLGALFWLLAALALVVYLVAAVVLLAHPQLRNLIFGVMMLAQTTNLLLIAVESVPGLGLAAGFARFGWLLRSACDIVLAASIVNAAAIHPRQVPGRNAFVGVTWLLAAIYIAALVGGQVSGAWWWTQGLMLTFGAVAIAILTWSHSLEPHPFAIVLRRFGLVTGGTLALLTIAIAAASRQSGMQLAIASVGSVIWYVFLASVLLLVPFLARSQQVMREFAMLAGITTVATSLDLLFVALFALGQFASLTLSLFLSLGIYAGARQWFLNQMIGSNMLTTERMFESLYRIAREIELNPAKTAEYLARLLRDLFEPLEVNRLARRVSRSRVVADGSTLVVPIPRLPGVREEDQPQGSISLRFAQRGRRMFTDHDARLTDRVIEQLARAVAYDHAVEQGRSEERARIAQDLHDDIGARLLTLMYKSQSPEMEEYIRHTLQDLKTLTRGLAASSHKLSHAAAEWKSDITQRLAATHCDLAWSFSIDHDVNLSVVQWSGLTRVLRELANNIIAHANATRVEVAGQFERGRFVLTVGDDGSGRQPENWSHGLGLGGVRKRVKLLGGDVRWRENGARGIVCEVRVPELGERR